MYHIRYYMIINLDSRISKYEENLKTDEILYLYQVEGENQRFSKHRSKTIIKELLKDVLKKKFQMN